MGRRVDPDDVVAFLMLQVMVFFSDYWDWPDLNEAVHEIKASAEWDPAIVAAAQRQWGSVQAAVERQAVHHGAPVNQQKKRHRWVQLRQDGGEGDAEPGAYQCVRCDCVRRDMVSPAPRGWVFCMPGRSPSSVLLNDPRPPCEPPPSNKKTDTGDRK